MDLQFSSKPQRIKISKANFPLKSHIAAVSTSSLLQLGILNNSWLHITSRYAETDRQQKVHPTISLCFVSYQNDKFDECALSSENFVAEEGIAYVSTESAFNVLINDIESFNRFDEGGHVDVYMHQIQDIQFEPPMATIIRISAIRSPVMSDFQNEYYDYLKSHFKERRHFVKNQLFGICCQQQYTKQQIDAPFIWFKVLEMENDGKRVESAWVVDGMSTLYLDNSTSSITPFDVSRPDDYLVFSRVLNIALKSQILELKGLLTHVLCEQIPSAEVPILIHGPTASGKRSLAQLLASRFHIHFYDVNCQSLLGESLAAIEQRIESMARKAAYSSPCLLLLRNIDAFCKGNRSDGDEPRLIKYLANCFKGFHENEKVIIFATSNFYDQLSSSITRLFSYEIQTQVFDEGIRSGILRALINGNDSIECLVESICKKTAAMVLGDFCSLFFEAQQNAFRRNNFEGDNRSLLSLSDFDVALDKLHAEYKYTLGAPDVPEVHWNDVGGLASVKEEILDTIKLPLQYPELVSKGLRRSGLLLYGPPGCGKTLLAKAVATEFTLNFFSVKGPELINMYVGQSEQNIRDMFCKARESSPCIIFFDELDSIAPNRGKSGDSGGVMDRIVSQLLAELDGLQTSNDLFVIGATNRPDLIDNSLLRPGRFDKMVYVGFPETKEDRLNIIKSYTNKMQLNPRVDLDQIEASLPLYLTGADFYALCSDAFLNGIKRCINDDSLENDEKPDDGIVIEMQDFEFAVRELIPSVSTNDVVRYKEIKHRLEDSSAKVT